MVLEHVVLRVRPVVGNLALVVIARHVDALHLRALRAGLAARIGDRAVLSLLCLADESVHPAEKFVKTHCCFCGQQCGIQLKVRDNRVIGFEPWEEFPFNRGMLCPKGVKRYLQGNHPDRLLAPLMRSEQGFCPASWDEALNFTVSRMREIQEKYGKDAFAI